MLDLDPTLLDTSRGDLIPTTTFNAVLDAHGLYDGLRFVIRLSPRVHELLASSPGGIVTTADVSFEQLQAFSTYLHETMHWWQHAGSTCGFILSLSYPAQTHANLNYLQEFLKLVGPVKPIQAWAEANKGSSEPGTATATANVIINNRFDISAYRLLATNPERAQPLVGNKMFESIGHTYGIALSTSLNALASTFDRNREFIPDPSKLMDRLQALKADREIGYYHGSPIELSPIGAFHIFEGQARFGQLQYLHFATDGRFGWSEAESAGMLSPVYMTAFETFLAVAGLERPAAIDHPVVGLFLLICDIAANPGEAFPFEVPDPRAFISYVDPGIRFLLLCVAVREFCPDTAKMIVRYDAAEYAHVSGILCASTKMRAPLDVVGEVNRWVAEGEAFRRCLEQHDLGRSDPLNLPLQVLFGQFASFARDKARSPHILCWPGANIVGDALSSETEAVFRRQSPLFVDRADDETIVPITRTGVDETDAFQTFENFYDGFALYDLTTQWIAQPGLFRFDYRWLQPEGTAEDMKRWASRTFEETFGVSPDGFQVLR